MIHEDYLELESAWKHGEDSTMVEVVEKLASCQPNPCHELEDEVQVEVHEVKTKSVEWPLMIGTIQ